MSTTEFKNSVRRRRILAMNTEAELAIREAVNKVEAIGADVKLTDAIIKLQEAFELVADYVDQFVNKPVEN